MARLILIPSATGGLRLGLAGAGSLHAVTDANGATCCCQGGACCIWNRSSCDEKDPLTCCECGETFDVTVTGSVKDERWNFTTQRLEVYFHATWTITTRINCVTPTGDTFVEHRSGSATILVNRFAFQNGLPTSGTRPATAVIPDGFQVCGASIKLALSNLSIARVDVVVGSDVDIPINFSSLWWGDCSGTYFDQALGGRTYTLSSAWGCLGGSLDQLSVDPIYGERERLVLAWTFATVKPCGTHPCGGGESMTCEQFWAYFLSGDARADLNGDGFLDPLDYQLFQNQHPECAPGSTGGKSAAAEQVRLLVKAGARVRVRR